MGGRYWKHSNMEANKHGTHHIQPCEVAGKLAALIQCRLGPHHHLLLPLLLLGGGCGLAILQPRCRRCCCGHFLRPPASAPPVEQPHKDAAPERCRGQGGRLGVPLHHLGLVVKRAFVDYLSDLLALPQQTPERQPEGPHLQGAQDSPGSGSAPVLHGGSLLSFGDR
jgi:hypothetical protein